MVHNVHMLQLYLNSIAKGTLEEYLRKND